MSSAPKPAAAKPAAAKAPAKAAAKGAKAAVKPAVKRTELRKKNKHPLIPKIVDPAIKAAEEKARIDNKAAKELRRKQKHTALMAKQAYAKAVAEAKKKGVAPPAPYVKPRKPANKDKKVKKTTTAKYPANQKFYLKLTPLNQKFQTKFGFIFSELIGKSREKALCARNIHVAITAPKHHLYGRVGKLRYYTGKHKAFVKIGHVMYKLPWSVLGRSKLFDIARARRAHRLRHAHRVANYVAHLKASKKNSKVKVPAQPVKTEFKAPATVVYGKSKKFLKRQDKLKKAGKVTKPAVAKKAAAPATSGPAVPFPNVGRPLKNRKEAILAKLAQERRKKNQELKKAGKLPAKKNYKKINKERKAAKKAPKTAKAATKA